jgi:hypothetical protein
VLNLLAKLKLCTALAGRVMDSSMSACEETGPTGGIKASILYMLSAGDVFSTHATTSIFKQCLPGTSVLPQVSVQKISKYVTDHPNGQRILPAIRFANRGSLTGPKLTTISQTSK